MFMPFLRETFCIFAFPVGDEALCRFSHCGHGIAVFADRIHDERDRRQRLRDDLCVFSFIRSRTLPVLNSTEASPSASSGLFSNSVPIRKTI